MFHLASQTFTSGHELNEARLYALPASDDSCGEMERDDFVFGGLKSREP